MTDADGVGCVLAQARALVLWEQKTDRGEMDEQALILSPLCL